METERGKLVRWIDDKGFGFIKPESGGADIFIHISALKAMSRPPIVGDIIFYETSLDDKGKLRAINAKIEGVAQVLTVAPIDRKPKTQKSSTPQQRPPRSHNTYRPPHKKSGYRFIPVLLVVAAVSIISKFGNQNVTSGQPVLPIAVPPKPAQHFQCSGKVHCSEMTSYEEAEFYLQNCPGTKMDGDNDGIPCEQQF
ncbi:excalibur calcium-binding domain-containing protein [Methylomonas sp. OY6]|uniref:Excalibur calcium-binding domain-containing protein n=1 Tax=Methylomonas defluvii TaxID=3045149 RepID=A0ABU4UNE8_9GAMM|nr:excalibur calcium-binding domain-containing protein [Methylomonas sp. OY6]MDX8130377.1 excalibur calcium-binding domain-containing protein [Methylomonas sp. OY6]